MSTPHTTASVIWIPLQPISLMIKKVLMKEIKLTQELGCHLPMAAPMQPLVIHVQNEMQLEAFRSRNVVIILRK